MTALPSRSPLVSDAWRFAREAHAGQVREADGAPFVLHPLEVSVLVHAVGGADVVVAAALLHDAVEHAGATLPELRARFGPEVAELVGAVTEDAGIADYAERKGRLREAVALAGDDVVALFTADKVTKARELRAEAVAGELDARSAASRHGHYAESLEIAEARMPGHPLTALLRLELDELALLPALFWLPSACATL